MCWFWICCYFSNQTSHWRVIHKIKSTCWKKGLRLVEFTLYIVEREKYWRFDVKFMDLTLFLERMRQRWRLIMKTIESMLNLTVTVDWMWSFHIPYPSSSNKKWNSKKISNEFDTSFQLGIEIYSFPHKKSRCSQHVKLCHQYQKQFSHIKKLGSWKFHQILTICWSFITMNN